MLFFCTTNRQFLPHTRNTHCKMLAVGPGKWSLLFSYHSLLMSHISILYYPWLHSCPPSLHQLILQTQPWLLILKSKSFHPLLHLKLLPHVLPSKISTDQEDFTPWLSPAAPASSPRSPDRAIYSSVAQYTLFAAFIPFPHMCGPYASQNSTSYLMTQHRPWILQRIKFIFLHSTIACISFYWSTY
jgi:hypothetical protein